SGHTILMVTHDPDIARQADRRIELAHGHLSFDTAQHGPNHPMACPLANTDDCCTPVSGDDEIRVDHLLEQIWICGEEGTPAVAEFVGVEGAAGQLPIVGNDASPSRLLARMADARLVEFSPALNGSGNGQASPANNGSEVRLTESGARRARDVVRR